MGIFDGDGTRDSLADDFSKDRTRSITEGLRTSAGAVVVTAAGGAAVSEPVETGLEMVDDAKIEVDVRVVVDAAVKTDASFDPSAAPDVVCSRGLLVEEPMIPLVREPGSALCRACIFFMRLARASRRALEAASSRS